MSNDAVSCLAASLHHAQLVGLQDETYPEIKHVHNKETNRTERVETGKQCTRRPDLDMLSVTMFQQTWGSTALGFGGVGGQMVTSAYTVIVESSLGDCCVYFSGRFAYHIRKPGQAFYSDMAKQRMVGVASARSRYEE